MGYFYGIFGVFQGDDGNVQLKFDDCIFDVCFRVCLVLDVIQAGIVVLYLRQEFYIQLSYRIGSCYCKE